MNYLLDTNQWSYLQERHQQVVAHLRQLPNEVTIFMSVVSQAELLTGIELVTHTRRERTLRSLYQEVITMATEILPVTSEIALQFAKIHASLRRKGRPIETNDIWIASVALAHNLILVTSDEHFRYIDGLTVEDWTQG